MKVDEIKQKTRPGLEFCDFRMKKKTRAKNLLLLKNQLLIRISKTLKEQNSNEKFIFDEKRRNSNEKRTFNRKRG